jgi:hypothetical protein
MTQTPLHDLVDYYIARVDALTKELDKAEQEAMQVQALRQEIRMWRSVAHRIAEDTGVRGIIPTLLAEAYAGLLRGSDPCGSDP